VEWKEELLEMLREIGKGLRGVERGEKAEKGRNGKKR